MSPPALSVLIPAAGASRRLGQPKQLVQHHGETLLQRTIRNAATLTPVEIIVVTGANDTAVNAAIKRNAARQVHNPNWPAGMGDSIAKGAKTVSRESTGLLILLCDQWQIQTRDLQQLWHTWRTDTHRIVCAQVHERCSPPAIFPLSCFAELCDLRGDHGARGVVENHPELLYPIPMPNAAGDLDTPDQLETLQASQNTTTH